MEEATQQGADSQEVVTEDQDLASRMANIVDGTQPSEESSDEAVVETQETEDDSQAEDATPESEEEPKFTIKVDGEERELTKSELIAEAQKAQAATKRFEEAAQMRRQLESERQQFTQQVTQEREMLSQAVTQYTHQLQALMEQGQPDWNALLQHDPIAYLQQKEIFSQRQEQLQQARAAQAYLTEQQQAEAKQKHESTIAEHRAKLLEALPDWHDEAKAKAEGTEVAQLLMKNGLTKEEVRSVFHHGLIKTLVELSREAKQYKTLIAKQAPALKKVEKLPPKVEKTGSGVRPTDGRTAAMQQLTKSGRPEDAARVLANFM